MILIACVDDRMGMAFNKRRQSRDGAVCADILKLADGGKIGMDARSQKLFEGMEANIDVNAAAGECDYYFLELAAPSAYAAHAERIILYRWNRHYASDLKFDIDLTEYTLAETAEFAGNSHELITREVYIK